MGGAYDITALDITEWCLRTPNLQHWEELRDHLLPILIHSKHPTAPPLGLLQHPPNIPKNGCSPSIQLPTLIPCETQDPKPLPYSLLNKLLGPHTWYSNVVSPCAPSGPRAARRSLSRFRACCRTHRATARATSSPATPARATRVSSTERRGEVLWAGRGRTAVASSLCGNKGGLGGGRFQSCFSPLSHATLPARVTPGAKLGGQGHGGMGQRPQMAPQSSFSIYIRPTQPQCTAGDLVGDPTSSICI